MRTGERNSLARRLALVLRHAPEKFDLEMDINGWIDVKDIIHQFKKGGKRFHWLRPHHFRAIAETDPKGRYQLKNGRLRATYAHTLDLELDLPTDSNPEHLYFACSKEDAEEYLEHGLYPGDRNMVHLSSTRLNALEAGRHIIGKPVVLFSPVEFIPKKHLKGSTRTKAVRTP